MSCDFGRALPRWLLSTFNFLLLVISISALFMGILMAVVSDQVISLVTHTLNQVSLTEDIKMKISSLMRLNIISDVGNFLICSSVCVIIPSSLGYVGAMRESKVLLFLVRITGRLVSILQYNNCSVFCTFAVALGSSTIYFHPLAGFQEYS